MHGMEMEWNMERNMEQQIMHILSLIIIYLIMPFCKLTVQSVHNQTLAQAL